MGIGRVSVNIPSVLRNKANLSVKPFDGSDYTPRAAVLIISKDDHKKLKEKYITDENQLREANSILQEQLEDVLAGKSERLKWAEHFKRFGDMTEIDRRTVVSLIHSIKIKSKTELEITFNYQSEYESALALIRKEAA